MDYKWLLTADELADLLGITTDDIRLSVSEGVMPSPIRLHANGPRMWSRFQVLRWLEAGCPTVDDERAERAEAAYWQEQNDCNPRVLTDDERAFHLRACSPELEEIE